MGGTEIVTVLFTDLVGSTELLDRLGDDAAERVRRVHFGLLREAVAARRGEEVKNVGDGLMVVFGSALDAVSCAVAIQRAVARHNQRGEGAPLRVRVGLHVGEPIRAEDDYFGTVVNVAKRLCDAAAPDQILASQLVVDLVGTRGVVAFHGVGPLELKGLARPVAAAEVGWTLPVVEQPVAGVDFRVLGPVEALAPDGRPVRLASPRQRLLLACLLAHAGQVVGADQLVDALWETLPADPKDALHSQVARLRQRLGPAAPLETTPAGYRFTAPERVDAVRFERLVGTARGLDRDPEAALELWDAALSLWRGGAFLDVAEHPGVQPAVVRLSGLRIEAGEARVDALLAAGRVPDALTAAQILAAEEPLRERPVGLCMRALAAAGRYVEALEVYEAFRRRLAADVGLDPSPELRDLQGEILRHERPAGTTPAGAAAEPGGRPGLPARGAGFVGREAALAAVVVALGTSRLVTLTGPGGVGKSRLALESAHRVAATRPDGAWLCELAPVPDVGGVTFALAASAGVRQLTGAAAEDGLVEALSHRDALVVVDNCEHVLDGIVPLLERLLARCSGIRVLATSRERLAADRETVVEVPPLEVPAEDADPHAAWERPAPALQLLRDRVAAIRPGFSWDAAQQSALVEIARRLDGLPLALELAAARIATMGPLEVAGRMDRRFALLTSGRRSAPARHRTLGATLEWSYGLLADAERDAFEAATVFVGGFTLEAAEAVLAAIGTPGEADAVDLVSALADKSMLVVDGRGPVTRYRMLETLREFGHERLVAGGRLAALEAAHAEHYIGLAERAGAQLGGPAEARWVRILDAEVPNLRAAHTWAIRGGRRELAADLSASLVWFSFSAMRADVLAWAEDLVDDDPATAGPHLARALFAAGFSVWLRNDLDGALAIGGRAVATAAEETEQRWGLHVLAGARLLQGGLASACDHYRRAAELARRAGDHFHASRLLGGLALAHGYAGDLPAAVSTAGASRLEAVRSGAPAVLAFNAYVLGEVLMASDPEGALVHLDRAIALSATVGSHFTEGVARASATAVRARHSDPATAAAALLDVVGHWARDGNWRQQWVTLRHTAEFFARVGDDAAAATVLGAIDAGDARNVFGADAQRLATLRADLTARLGPAAAGHLADGGALAPKDLLAFVRRHLARHLRACRAEDAPGTAAQNHV